MLLMPSRASVGCRKARRLAAGRVSVQSPLISSGLIADCSIQERGSLGCAVVLGIPNMILKDREDKQSSSVVYILNYSIFFARKPQPSRVSRALVRRANSNVLLVLPAPAANVLACALVDLASPTSSASPSILSSLNTCCALPSLPATNNIRH